MWGGYFSIGYQFTNQRVISCRGGYSYTKDLTYPEVDFGSSEMKFSTRSFSLLFSFKSADFLLGTGMDISYINVAYKYWVPAEPNDTLVNILSQKTILLAPTVSASGQWKIIYPLYLKIQIESRILHFVKIGSEEIDLPKVQPSISIGLGHRFNF